VVDSSLAVALIQSIIVALGPNPLGDINRESLEKGFYERVMFGFS
jgi:hypothetical protein